MAETLEECQQSRKQKPYRIAGLPDVWEERPCLVPRHQHLHLLRAGVHPHLGFVRHLVFWHIHACAGQNTNDSGLDIYLLWQRYTNSFTKGMPYGAMVQGE